MALLNPVHGLVVPFLCVFTIPLAIFAGITTTLAFTVLMFRVAAVYLDIALGLIPQYFTGRSRTRALPADAEPLQRRASRDGSKTPISPPSSAGSGSGANTPSSLSQFPQGSVHMASDYHGPGTRRKSSYGFGSALRHSRRSSQVSLASMGTITPIHEDDVAPPITETSMTPSVGLNRDFEGVGGWRLDDRDDDGNWTNINSRLELPVERVSFRHHQRSQSLGPVNPSEAVWLASKSRVDVSPDGKGWERLRSASVAKSPGKPLGSPNNQRFNQHISLPSAMTALDPRNGYFPDLVSPRSSKRFTP